MVFLELKQMKAFSIIIFLVFSAAVWGQTPQVSLGRTNKTIQVDGHLDEPAWTEAGIIGDLVQQEPDPLAPTPYRTVVRLLAGPDALYLGFECADPNPRSIVVHSLQRDSEMEGEDSVALVLDTFGDGRSGFLFRVNAGGARQDGLVTNPEHPSLDWDGIWEARCRRHTGGWTAELAIPTHTLRFPPDRTSWGLEVERYVAGSRITLRWAGTTPDSFFLDLRRAGSLTDTAGLRQGLGLSMTPYGVGRTAKDHLVDDRVTTGTGGFDVSYSVTPGLSGVLTVNTDFAETEVDTRQLNVTRFPLFFPEKRAFFLEGSDQFVFGLDLDEDFSPFYSRRIGLYQGMPVPIDAGLKFIGRAGRWGIGVLDVQTRDKSGIPGTNLFAGRFTFDVNRQLRVGTIITNGHPDGITDNTLAGIDAVWSTSEMFGDKNFMVGGWYAKSAGDRLPGRSDGWGFKVDYPNDLWDLAFRMNTYGEALDPGLGWLPRPGTRQYNMSANYMPRPAADGFWSWARQFFFGAHARRVDAIDGPTESFEIFTEPLGVELQSGEHMELNYYHQYENLDEPFEIAEGVVIPAGEYDYDRAGIQFETAESRLWSVGGEYWSGTFFGGRMTNVQASAGWTTLAGQLRLGVETDQYFGHLPGGNFVQRLYQFRGTLALNPNLVFTSYVQYDTESHEMGANNRLAWTIKPGVECFLVWNYNWRVPLDEGLREMAPLNDLLAVKLRWTFRM